MAITAKDGHGTTITFGTSGFAAKLIDVDGPGVTRGAIDVTTMDVAAQMEYLEASLFDGGEVDITFQYLGSDDPPIDAATEAIVIDWAGTGAGHKTNFNGFMTAHRPGARIGDRMTSTSTLKVASGLLFAQT